MTDLDREFATFTQYSRTVRVLELVRIPLVLILAVLVPLAWLL